MDYPKIPTNHRLYFEISTFVNSLCFRNNDVMDNQYSKVNDSSHDGLLKETLTENI